MAGGNFTTQNKVRPGAYVNFQADVSTGTSDAVGGVVTLPLEVDFGPSGVVAISAETDLTAFGYGLGDKPLQPLREALKNANTVLAFRIGGGSAASGTGQGLTATAKYAGERGNAIHVVIETQANGATKVDTVLAGKIVDSQQVSKGADLKENQLVTFEAVDPLTDGTIQLAGGANATGTGADYAAYFEAIQVYDYNVMALPVADSETKALAAGFTRRLREQEGKKVQVVLGNYDGADYEGVINVANGVVLNSEVLTPEQTTAWVAGASAAAGVANSLTYTPYQGATDASPRFTNAETIEQIQKGNIVFTEKRGQAVIEQDINTLVSYSAEKNQDFAKNRVLRVLDNIANNTKITFEDNYIGQVNNNVDGRELFKADRIAYFDSLVAAGAIEAFEADDIQVLPGNAKDSIVVNVAVTPLDAMEKLYMTVEVN
ncbi:phage tail sheath family protein [Aerococcus urinaeequi]|uniref:phage tail sheath family protein n=1 Tax=Aerococcus urinaeequi TaxID=51665 RepID=UPI003EC6C66E